jgi:diacylglycerol kinase (ATP)
MKKVAFIVKGISKKYSRFESFYKELDLDGYSFEIKLTKHAEHAKFLAVEAVNEGFDYVVAVGGDGTLNEVVNGLFGANKTNIVLGHLPLGTANDFARLLQQKLDAQHFMNLLQTDSFKSVDVGRIQATNREGNEETNYFVNVLDIGLGAHIVNQVDLNDKGLGGKKMKFFRAITEGMFNYKKPMVKIVAENFKYEGALMMCMVCNASDFANKLTINPDAVIDDGIFNVTLVGDVTTADYIANFFKLRQGKKMSHPNISYYESNYFSIESEEAFSCPMEIDGEFIGFAPAKGAIIAGGIRMLLPF